MEKLNQLQQKLKARATFQLDVMDCVTEKYYAKAVNQAMLDEKYNGKLIDYLNSLKNAGLTKLQLIPRIKNGSGSKPGGIFVTVDFTTPQNPAPSPQITNPGLNGSFGLGMPEILNGMTAQRELEIVKENYRKLEQDYRDEKEAKRKWRDKAEKYSRENERHQYKEDIQREPSAIDKLIDGLAQNPSAIPALIGAFKGSAGLNSPNPSLPQVVDPFEGYTELQRALCETIGQLPENLCEDLATLISRISENNPIFNKELKKLIETPNLKAVKNG